MPYTDPQQKKESDKKYRESNKEKIKEYQANYIKTHDLSEYKKAWYGDRRFTQYGITREVFEKMLEAQNNSCDICRFFFSKDKRPYIDHCHSTLKVRGLLCMNCNTGLGHFRDDINLLDKAKEYLNK